MLSFYGLEVIRFQHWRGHHQAATLYALTTVVITLHQTHVGTACMMK